MQNIAERREDLGAVVVKRDGHPGGERLGLEVEMEVTGAGVCAAAAAAVACERVGGWGLQEGVEQLEVFAVDGPLLCLSDV